MKTYSSVTIILVILIVLLLAAGIILQPESLTIPAIVFIILISVVDAVFLISERKKIRKSEKYVYSLMIVISIAIVVYIYLKNGFESISFIIFIALGLAGIRGLIFGSQTLEAIRIDNEYIEYGFGFFDHVRINLINSYSIDYDKKVLILNKEQKKIRIKIKYLEDIGKLDEVLQSKIKDRTVS